MTNSIDNDNTIQLYPNPTSNTINIHYNTSLDNASIRLYDMTGALLQEFKNQNGNDINLNLASYANGIYQIEIINLGEKYRSKVIKD